jgi:ketosteroid isomerase-like protein
MTDSQSRLADEATITALRVTFGHAVDTRNWNLLDAVFAEHVEADFSAFGVPAAKMPRANVVAIFQRSFRHDHVRTFQAYSNFQVEVAGDTATMISLLHGHHTGEGFEGGNVFELRARYNDRLVRTGNGWRIAGVKLEVISLSGNMALVA